MGTLNLVATPIGNLNDITLRALKALEDAEVIYCEDTRVTRKLLTHFNIKATGKKIASFNQTNERSRLDELNDDLIGGKNVCIVSDAGMPTISDPGAAAVYVLRETGHKISVIPGSSSVVCALAISGFNSDRFYFAGFLPKRQSERLKELEFMVGLNCTSAFFESPHRLEETLTEVAQLVHPKTKICIVKELTKLNETVLVFEAEQIKAIIDNLVIKGEFVVLISPINIQLNDSDTDAIRLYEELIEVGVDSKTAIIFVAKHLNVSKNHLYALIKVS